LIEPLGELRKDGKHAVNGGRLTLAQRADREVVPYREPREHRVLLRHVADAHPHPLFGFAATDLPAVKLDLSLR